MMINNECARDILKELSKLNFNDSLIIIDFLEKHPEYPEKEVYDACIYLMKREYIIYNNVKYVDDPVEVDKYSKVKMNIRWKELIPYSLYDDAIWEEVKSKIDITKYSFKSLTDMLIRKELMELNKAFGIDNDITIMG